MLKVMIVDDMDISRREIKRLKLWGEEIGFEIALEAKNGHDALLKLETNAVDLIISDIKMPKVDGLELLQKAIYKKYCTCIILMSDYSDFNYVRKGLVSGAFDYILKPVDEKELNNVLKRAKEFILNRRNEEEKLREMELKLSEKVEVYFPKADVEQIINIICEGNPKGLELISQMVDKIGRVLKYDLIKIESILKNMFLEVGSKLFEYYIWFEKFFNKNEFISINFLGCNDFNSLKDIFLGSIDKIFLKISKLKCTNYQNSMIDDICKCVLENVDEEVSLKFISDRLFMNKTYISEAFKQKTGISFIEYLTTVKMERAMKLIKEGNLKVYEISNKLGFKDSEYFSKVFKKYTGTSPGKFI